MHLLAATPGLVLDDDQAVDLAQSSAGIVCLTMADSEIAGLARARRKTGTELRLANALALKHPYSVDLYVERTLANAKVIVARLLGGRSYWPYGVDRLVETARRRPARHSCWTRHGGSHRGPRPGRSPGPGWRASGIEGRGNSVRPMPAGPAEARRARRRAAGALPSGVLWCSPSCSSAPVAAVRVFVRPTG